jgi:16S rRNA (cytidine1402-2'-O)-methyltransferase
VEEVMAQLKQRGQVQGEITLLVGRPAEEPHPLAEVPLRTRVEEIMRGQNINRMAALKVVARERGISKSQAYREYEEKEEDTGPGSH